MPASATTPPRLDQPWLAAAALVALAATLGRVHNAFAYPPLLDYDGPGHALNVFALHEGRLPDVHAWSGFHPPLYPALGALLWQVVPEAIPVHVALRLLSLAAGAAAAWITWRVLERRFPASDAAAVATLAWCAPVFAIATSMLGNETTCTLAVTAVLARLAAVPDAPRRALRHALGTGLLAGLAALAKATGLAVLPVAAGTYAFALRRRPAAAAAAAAVAALLPILLSAPHYGRLLAASGSPLAVASGGLLSREMRWEMAQQPPGERHWIDYFRIPPAALLAPFAPAPGMFQSVPGLLYASTWADGQVAFLPERNSSVQVAAALAAIAGLLPTGLAALGAASLILRRRGPPGVGPALVYAALLGAAFTVQTWMVPHYSAVKASYLLSALLPAALLVASGLGAFGQRARDGLRAALLAIALYTTGLTWYGWWL